MEIVIICVMAFLAGMYVLRTQDTSTSFVSEYKDLGDGKWITPDGYVDFNNPQLTAEEEIHNMNNEREIKRRDMEYDAEVALKTYEARIKLHTAYGDRVDAMSHKEKMSYFDGWVDHLVDFELNATTHEKTWGPKFFEMYIACEMNPYKSIEVPAVFKPRIFQIEYVV